MFICPHSGLICRFSPYNLYYMPILCAYVTKSLEHSVQITPQCNSNVASMLHFVLNCGYPSNSHNSLTYKHIHHLYSTYQELHFVLSPLHILWDSIKCDKMNRNDHVFGKVFYLCRTRKLGELPKFARWTISSHWITFGATKSYLTSYLIAEKQPSRYL